MTLHRMVSGYITDSTLPGIIRPAELDLNDTGGLPTSTSHQVGSVPAASGLAGVTVVERGDGITHQSVFTLSAVSVTMTDATTAGCHGSIQLYDFPQALLNLAGACMSLTLTAGAGGISDTAAALVGIGTGAVATDNATLVGSGEADIIPSTAYTLVGGVKAATGVSTTGLLAVSNGTATAKKAYLNIVVPDDDSSASDTFTVDGTVTITWLHLGDV